MESAWQLFLSRLASPDFAFGYDDVCGWTADEFDALTGEGLLSEIAQATRVVCDACPKGHRERVRWSEDRRTAFITCPLAGIVGVEPERLRRWRAHAGQLSALLSTAITPPGQVHPLPACQIWFLGRRRVGGFTPYFFFAAIGPDQLSPATDAVHAAYGRVNSVVLVPFSPPSSLPDAKLRIIDVAKVATLQNRRLSIDLSLIEAQFGDEESPKKLAKPPKKSLKEHRMSILRSYMPSAGVHDMSGLATHLRIDRSVIYGIVRGDRRKYGESTLSAMLNMIGCPRAKWDRAPSPVSRA